MAGFRRPFYRDEQRMRRFMSITGASMIYTPVGTTLFSSDGSSLTGWTNSGLSVNATQGNPFPSFQGGSGNNAHRLVTGARRWKVDIDGGSVGALCDFQFGCASTGAGCMFRVDKRTSQVSGIGGCSAWTTFPTPPSGVGSLGTAYFGTGFYTIEIVCNPAATAVDVFVNGTLALSAVPVTLSGDYIGIISEIGTIKFDNIIVSAS